MNLTKTGIDGLVLLTPKIFDDDRGYFFESYNYKKINNLLGDIKFVQDNQSRSSKGVLRGLHFQSPPFSQAKLVRCIEGEILDVAVDLRTNSKSFGLHNSTILSNTNKKMLFIPEGFAHGFIVLSSFAIVSYKVNNYYDLKSENGILWNDPHLGIDWKINSKKVIVSKKDSSLPAFTNIVNPF